MKKNLGFFLATFFLSTYCFAAQTDENRTLTIIASEPGDKGYFRTVEGFTLSCRYNVVYFDLASPSGQGYMSLLLAAKMSEKKITITYERKADETCAVTHVTIL